jgi:hypothetical protein
MKAATGQAQDVEALYSTAKERLDALVAERARCLVDNPDLYFFPDARDRELVGEIHAARREFLSLRARYRSARGEYLFVGCGVGEHKRCRREITRDGARLVCGCPCHQTKEV